MNFLDYVIRITDKGADVFKKHTDAANQLTTAVGKTGSIVDQIGGKFLKWNQIEQSMQGIAEAINTISEPGMKLQDSMAELSSITGITGAGLTDISDKARALGKAFGADAAVAATAYTDILSRLGTEVAASPKALDAMGNSVLVLSKSMRGDVNGAMDALTTGMLQYGVSMKDPVKAAAIMNTQMNIMAMGAVKGSAMIPQVSAALKTAGGTAANAGVSFAEANAAIQVLGKGALYGSEAGTTLRNTLLKMGEGRFLPPDTQKALQGAGVDIAKLSDKTVPLATRLTELKKIQGDSALMAKVFGSENVNGATILLQNTDTLKSWTNELLNTNTATDAAQINMNTMSERIKRMTAAWSDLGIGVYAYIEPMIPALKVTVGAMRMYSQLAPALGLLKDGFMSAGKWAWEFGKKNLAAGQSALKSAASFVYTALVGIGSFVSSMVAATAAQLGLNVAMYANPVGLAVVGILALGTAIYALIANWDTVKVWLYNIANYAIKMNPFYWLYQGAITAFPGIGKLLDEWWVKIKSWVDTVFGYLGKLWDTIKELTGAGADIKLKATVQQSGDVYGASFGGATPPANAKLSQNTKAASDGVTGGGAKHTNITINIKNLIETLNNYISNADALGKNIEDPVLNALMRAINMAQGQTQ